MQYFPQDHSKIKLCTTITICSINNNEACNNMAACFLCHASANNKQDMFSNSMPVILIWALVHGELDFMTFLNYAKIGVIPQRHHPVQGSHEILRCSKLNEEMRKPSHDRWQLWSAQWNHKNNRKQHAMDQIPDYHAENALLPIHFCANNLSCYGCEMLSKISMSLNMQKQKITFKRWCNEGHIAAYDLACPLAIRRRSTSNAAGASVSPKGLSFVRSLTKVGPLVKSPVTLHAWWLLINIKPSVSIWNLAK